MGISHTLSRILSGLFQKKTARIGIYGPPNAGKTTLANRIAGDWSGTISGTTSEVPHETRRAARSGNITITGSNGKSVTIDIVDTPGVTTRVDYKEFLEYGIEREDAINRAREATEGVAEAMHWLREDIDGVIYMIDATLDPFAQVNIMMIGIIESRKLPVIIAANKIDLPDATPQRIRNAFPQHPVVPVSCLDGTQIESLYEEMVRHFR
ncbi:Era-like GTP-binding protein [Methanospirillum stamsii]|uniref:GTP-binding protein n=1 Tax=Methanospirillum stamsii TaxID=1277351 RepID=A0A2V2N6B8_9EURY|nr:Era-like GTP-binding protein [Methanospirillum stamsii]PWR75622.1 GTP-binding protein [Methanospirillum stamsii]